MFSVKKVGRARFVAAVCIFAFSSVSASNKALASSELKDGATPDQISMCIYPILKDNDGKQYIVTRAGYKVHVPGLGISPQATAIALYGDGAGNFWYVDKKGRTQKMTDKQVQWGLAQFNQQAVMAQQQGGMPQQQGGMPQQQVMQQAPQAGYVQEQGPSDQQPQVVVVQGAAPAAQGSSSGGASALATGLAAAGGAMAGTALTNSLYNHGNYYGVPYGQPVYNAGGRYYCNGANGSRAYIPPNAHYTDQWHEQRVEHREDRRGDLNQRQQQVIKNKAVVNRNETGSIRGGGRQASAGRAGGGRAGGGHAGSRGGGGRRR